MHGSPQAGRERVAALTDQLAIVRWQLDQVRQQIRAMQRNLRNTETTAETRARVLREMAAATNQGDSQQTHGQRQRCGCNSGRQ